MKISEMIAKLQEIQDEIGDTEVLISDGYECKFYQGNYEITKFLDYEKGVECVDIGIGGCSD